MRSQFGTYLRGLRESRLITARRFAQSIGMDPSNYSKIERGEVPPPSEAIVAKIAEGLGISVVTDEWYDLKFHADVSRGEVPTELLEREDELTALLPAFFAQLRKEPVGSLSDMLDIYKAVAAGRADTLPNTRREKPKE